jgi:hypothetical protein
VPAVLWHSSANFRPIQRLELSIAGVDSAKWEVVDLARSPARKSKSRLKVLGRLPVGAIDVASLHAASHERSIRASWRIQDRVVRLVIAWHLRCAERTTLEAL